MLQSYNPFIRISSEETIDFFQNGYTFVFIQKLLWLGLRVNTGFIVTSYQKEQEAIFHQNELHKKEEKTFNLNIEIETFISIVGNRNFQIFLSNFRKDKKA